MSEDWIRDDESITVLVVHHASKLDSILARFLEKEYDSTRPEGCLQLKPSRSDRNLQWPLLDGEGQ